MVTKNKTPAEVEAVTITMSRETAQAVKQACEEYLRFRMGQFEDFTNEVCCWDYVDKMEKRCHTTEERKQFHKDHEADFLKCMRLRNQMRQGILGENVPRIHPALLRTYHHRQQHPAPDRAPISQRDRDAAEQEEPALSMRMELSDLPPKYRAQAEAQIAARSRAKAPTLEAVAAAAKKTGREFDSRGEYDYYMGIILPKVQRGEVVKVESHRRFTMLPEKEYGNVKLPAMHYTPDFVLTYADGTVEVVEVKSKFTRRQQRDYIHRRRMFIDLVAEPRGWRFVEHITPDTAAEIKAWKKCAQQTKRKG